MANNEDILRAIGTLEGKMDMVIANQNNFEQQQITINSKQDERLRKTEVKAAVNGTVSGGIVAGAILLIKEFLKTTTTGS